MSAIAPAPMTAILGLFLSITSAPCGSGWFRAYAVQRYVVHRDRLDADTASTLQEQGRTVASVLLYGSHVAPELHLGAPSRGASTPAPRWRPVQKLLMEQGW